MREAKQMKSGLLQRGRARGVTLVEVLIVIAIIGIASGIAILGSGIADAARLRRSATMIAGAIRIAYAHANATSKPVRLVFDLDEHRVSIEESSSTLKVSKKDRTGGAAAATEAEKKAQEEAEAIVQGPRAPRPTFTAAKPAGFSGDAGKAGKALERNIKFLQMETEHDPDVVRSGRAYLYFWPGGQTEDAAIQLSMGGSEAEQDVMTLIVSPLTGKSAIKKGRYTMPRPRDDREDSEREDTGF